MRCRSLSADVLPIYLGVVEDYDRDEYLEAGGQVPFPRSRVLIRFEDRPAELAGFYMPDDGDVPRVFIYRKGFIDDDCYRALDIARDATDPLGELIALSHELGHHELVLLGAGKGVFDFERPMESYGEEVAAWLLAERLLARRGFIYWREFRRLSASALETYENNLPLTSQEAAQIRRSWRSRLGADPDLHITQPRVKAEVSRRAFEWGRAARRA